MHGPSHPQARATESLAEPVGDNIELPNQSEIDPADMLTNHNQCNSNSYGTQSWRSGSI